ncbi:MAG: zf-TFIIB domain-containing protein [Mariniblastus sp.]
MKCPKCCETIRRSKYAGSSVFECSTCYGHLVEHRRVGKIEKRINKDIAELKDEILDSEGSDLVEKIRCPRCRNRMKKQVIKKLGFHLDECSNCDSVWFDGGELAKLQLAFEGKSQTQEINKMRERLENLTEAQKKVYEDRIANLDDKGSQMSQVVTGATAELAFQFYWDGF